MKKIVYIFISLIPALMGCNRENSLDQESVMQDDTDPRTSLDDYIRSQFITPYNIDVNYKYVDANYDMGRYLYPPTESKVQPFLQMIRRVWIESYEQVAGTSFVSQVAPRQIALIGGRSLDPLTHEETLGLADNGTKITLARVDFFDPNQPDAENIKHIIHTIQHEYCHIINQRKPFSPNFGKITPSGYTNTYNNFTKEQANALGFITPYSMANPFEDFAEMTSNMLLKSKTEWDTAIAALSETGKTAIKKKEDFIVEYFRTEWNIDFYQLQRVARERMQYYL